METGIGFVIHLKDMTFVLEVSAYRIEESTSIFTLSSPVLDFSIYCVHLGLTILNYRKLCLEFFLNLFINLEQAHLYSTRCYWFLHECQNQSLTNRNRIQSGKSKAHSLENLKVLSDLSTSWRHFQIIICIKLQGDPNQTLLIQMAITL